MMTKIAFMEKLSSTLISGNARHYSVGNFSVFSSPGWKGET